MGFHLLLISKCFSFFISFISRNNITDLVGKKSLFLSFPRVPILNMNKSLCFLTLLGKESLWILQVVLFSRGRGVLRMWFWDCLFSPLLTFLTHPKDNESILNEKHNCIYCIQYADKSKRLETVCIVVCIFFLTLLWLSQPAHGY